MDVKTIDRRIGQFFNGVRQAFRGKIARVSSGGGVQKIQVAGLDGETVQDLEHAENFGFTSHPPAGSDCVVVPLGGKTSHGIIVTTTNGAYRITNLAEGETAVYNAAGAKIVLKQGRVIDIDCETLNIKAPGGVNIEAPNVDCSAEITAAAQINGNGGLAIKGGNGATFMGDVNQTQGDFTTDGDVQAGNVSLRRHPHTDSMGGQTSPPLPS